MAAVQEAVRRLSIQATTSGVDTATAKLDQLSDAQQNVAVTSQETERATLSLEKRFVSLERRYLEQVRVQQEYERVQKQVNAAVAQNPALQSRATAVLEAVRQKLERVTGAANDNTKATGLARHELINLSRQAQDVAVSLAGGQSPLTVLFQQGSQIGDIFTSSQGSLRGFTSQVASALTPVRLLGLGIVATGAVAIAAAVSWKNFALALDDVSKQAGVASRDMAKLQAAASFKGIGQDEFASGIKQFSANVYDAKDGLGQLATVLQANGKSARDFDSALGGAADVIKNASSDQQRLVLLQQMGLPATMQWVRLLLDGADGIARAKDMATQFDGAANDNMVRRAREFDESWNRAITNLRTGWNSLFLDVFRWFDDLSSKGTAALIKIASYLPKSLRPDIAGNIFRVSMQDNVGSRLTQSKADEFYGAVSSSFKPPAGSGSSVDPEKLKALIGLEQQRIGILGQTATVSDQVRSVELQITQARLNHVNISGDEEVKLKAIARENALGITQIKAQADAYRTHAGTIGMSLGQAVAYTAEQNRLNEAIRNNQVLTEADKASIHAAAVAMGEAAQASAEKLAKDQALFDLQTAGLTGVDQQIAQLQFRLHGKDWQQFMNDGLAATMRLTDAMRQMNDAVKGFGQDLLSSLQQGKDLFTSLLGAASNFATKLANMGLDKMMSGLTGGGDFSKMFAGIGQSASQGIVEGFDAIQAKAAAAKANPANSFSFNGTGNMGMAGLAAVGAGLGIYAQGQQIGAAGGSPTSAALSGAITGGLSGGMLAGMTGGAVAGPVGIAIGAVVGGIAGLLGASDGAKKAAQQAKDDWANAKTAADLFGKQLAGSGQGSLTTALAQAKSQTEQYTIMAQKAKDQESSDRLGEQYNQYYKRMTEAFRDSFGGIVDAFNSGLGPNSPFATGAKNVKDIGDELKGFIEDTKTAMDYLAPGASGSAVAQATAAAQKYMLSLLGQAPVLTDTQTAIQHLSGTAAQLQTTLVDLGMSSKDAADAINAGVLASMKQLADTFANGIQREINAASGQDYLNSISDLVAKFQSNLADAAALGLGPDLVNKWFKVSAQKIVDDAGLAGDAIAGLVKQFPDLAGVITASVSSIQSAYDSATSAVDEARNNLQKSYEAEASKLNDVISKTQSFIKSIQQFKDSLKLDQNLSPLDPYQRLVEAQKQYQQVIGDAMGGNQDAMDRVQDVSRAYLEEAKAYYGSSATYFDIFNSVNSVLDGVLATANSQLSDTQKQLDLLNQQVDGLITINDSVLSVVDAIAALNAAVLTQNNAAGDLVNASPSSNLDLLYKTILGRDADATGKAYWQGQIAAGLTGSDLIRSFISGAQPGADATAAAAYAAKYGYQNGGIVGSYATGGVVGNGIMGVDSVLARFAGGGYIGLAGGEGILTASATQRIGGASAISAINAGRYAANDTGWRDVVAALKSEMGALRQQNAELTQRLIAVTGAGAQMNVDATRENTGAVRQQADAARQAKYDRKVA